MIRSVSLWHITPADIGIEFFDPTNTLLSADESLYNLVNDPDTVIKKQNYSESDYASLLKMRSFLQEVKTRINLMGSAKFVDTFPGLIGCIAKFELNPNLFCYIMASGIVTFYERGESIPFEDINYFSIPVFYERKVYEDDYCNNPEVTPRKKPLYDFLKLLWKCVENKEFHFSSTEDFGNHGIRYTLCIIMIDDPDMVSNDIDEQAKKNVRAMLDTSPFSNILQTNQWDIIKQRIDNDNYDDLELQQLSENLVFADNWSGVVLMGDLENNLTCITWFMEFELFLQSQWLLFDAYCENVVRKDMSTLELQGILNRVEFVKVKLDNDISSNMEQSRHIMRNSLIESSDINTIYFRMHGMVENKLKLKIMSDEKKRARFSLLSDLSLLIIAILQIYGVINEFLTKTAFTRTDYITMAIMLGISAVCVWVMIKGKN